MNLNPAVEEEETTSQARALAGNRGRFPFLQKTFENQGNRTGKGQKRCSFGSRIRGCLGYRHNGLGLGLMAECAVGCRDDAARTPVRFSQV